MTLSGGDASLLDPNITYADPTITGTVTGLDDVVNVTIEIHHNGVAIETLLTDLSGNFSYTPTDLTYGNITLSARIKEWDSSYATNLYSSLAISHFQLPTRNTSQHYHA